MTRGWSSEGSCESQRMVHVIVAAAWLTFTQCTAAYQLLGDHQLGVEGHGCQNQQTTKDACSQFKKRSFQRRFTQMHQTHAYRG